MIVGSFLFILFVTSDLAERVDFDYLFLAMLVGGIGWLLYNRNRARPAAAGRFAFLRRARQGRKTDEKEKK
ncbi:MAG TPA: hypothetical protein VIV15_01680 [Anaerolineales bacterium]